jgi:IS5 family transposase
MSTKRFKRLGIGTFFGSFVYERVVPRDHFLVKLEQVIEWDGLVPIILPAYQGLAEQGRPPYLPVVLLKMLVVSYLYHLSERETEQVVNYHLAVKEFVGLAVDEAAPDHSTLSLFKRRLREAGCWEHFQAIGDSVLQQARAAGIVLGAIQVVDSVHSVADLDKEADRQRREQGKPTRDPQAEVVHKGKRRVTDAEGKVNAQEVRYLGYKSHVSLNAQTGLITSIQPTPGSAPDNGQFLKLLAHDRQAGVDAAIYAGDRAYDDTDLHYALAEEGKCSALRLNGYRTTKKDANQEIWHAMLSSAEYQAGLAERYKVERKFGEGKRWHGWGRCRYLGLIRYGIQAYLTALVLNLKQIVQLLTGVRFRAGKRKPQLARS